jgi:hypothetical protein
MHRHAIYLHAAEYHFEDHHRQGVARLLAGKDEIASVLVLDLARGLKRGSELRSSLQRVTLGRLHLREGLDDAAAEAKARAEALRPILDELADKPALTVASSINTTRTSLPSMRSSSAEKPGRISMGSAPDTAGS